MPSYVVGWDRRARKDELATGLSIVDFAADVIPDFWLQLPFVDEPRCLTLKYERRIDCDGLPCVSIHIQAHLASRGLTCAFRLSASFRTFDDDGADGL
jgi:hypothetical protein